MAKSSMRSWRGNRQALIQTLNCVSDNRPKYFSITSIFMIRVNFPRRRAPRMMKSVAAEVLDR